MPVFNGVVPTLRIQVRPLSLAPSVPIATLLLAVVKLLPALAPIQVLLLPRDVEPGPIADRGIVVTAYVAKERTPTKAVVKQASCLVEERLKAERVAAVAGGGVVKERLGTEGAISVAGGVVKERLPTDGSVLGRRCS